MTYRPSEKYLGVFTETKVFDKRGNPMRPIKEIFGILLKADHCQETWEHGKTTIKILDLWIGWQKDDQIITDDDMVDRHSVVTMGDVLDTYPNESEPVNTSRT